jgi:hypothetical protein
MEGSTAPGEVLIYAIVATIVTIDHEPFEVAIHEETEFNFMTARSTGF